MVFHHQIGRIKLPQLQRDGTPGMPALKLTGKLMNGYVAIGAMELSSVIALAPVQSRWRSGPAGHALPRPVRFVCLPLASRLLRPVVD